MPPKTRTPVLSVRDVTLFVLDPQKDRKRLQALLETCEDYHVMVGGEPAGKEDADATFAALPPGKEHGDKFVLGIEDADGDLVGVLDLIRDYPETDVWYLGLLLLHPDQRSKGLGAELYQALAAWAWGLGARWISLGVVNQNKAGLRFWRRMGFRESGRKLMRFGQKDSVVLVMRNLLRAPRT